MRLIVLTVNEDADFARAALDAGGLGYVVKAPLASDLLPAIRAALADRRFISPILRLDEGVWGATEQKTGLRNDPYSSSGASGLRRGRN